MKTTSKIVITIVGLTLLLVVFAVPVLAQTNKKMDIATLKEMIDNLRKKIEELKSKIEAFIKARLELQQTVKEIKETLQISRELEPGIKNEEVKLLQELLATDPEIYPEGLVTGYYGPLTTKAVKRFQEKANLEAGGKVDSKTLSRINEILAEGAGKSGKVPPGLLIAPGIRKKLEGVIFQPLPGQVLPPGIAKKIETVTPPAEGLVPPIDTVTSANEGVGL